MPAPLDAAFCGFTEHPEGKHSNPLFPTSAHHDPSTATDPTQQTPLSALSGLAQQVQLVLTFSN